MDSQPHQPLSSPSAHTSREQVSSAGQCAPGGPVRAAEWWDGLSVGRLDGELGEKFKRNLMEIDFCLTLPNSMKQSVIRSRLPAAVFFFLYIYK